MDVYISVNAHRCNRTQSLACQFLMHHFFQTTHPFSLKIGLTTELFRCSSIDHFVALVFLKSCLGNYVYLARGHAALKAGSRPMHSQREDFTNDGSNM